MQRTKTYNKSILREILSSKARFTSILLIILLGSAFFTGIKSTSPDMNKSINKYYDEHNLFDAKLLSSTGFSDKDIDKIRNEEEIESYYLTRSLDINLINLNKVVKFMEYDGNDDINKFDIIEGRLPENSGEIALDVKALDENSDLKIGDNYILEDNTKAGSLLKTTSYKIVGFVNSPMYIELNSRGTTTVGKGTIDYFAVINSEDILMNIYPELYVKFSNTNKLDCYSDEYEDIIEDNIENLEEIFKDSNVHIFDRTYNPGYSSYKDAINSIRNISKVLPLFFFLVAVLICLTTMTRMVEEKRIEIGTLKALGYDDFKISKKYIIYAALASITGSIIGIVAGSNIFPYVIITSYKAMFITGSIQVNYYLEFALSALIISILCTVGAASVVLKEELRNIPSDLMRAKAPKIGKKIFLEKVTPLWRRLKFNQKVTLRNIFRYKQRMLMTVFGVAGCMAMLVTGFSLQNSNTLMMKRQFEELWNYNAMVVFNKDYSKTDDEVYNEILTAIPGYKNKIGIHQESLTFKKDGMNNQTVSLFVPENVDDFDNYIVLRDRKSKEEYILEEEGAVISEKLAKLLGVSIGDTVSFEDADNNVYEVKISFISENYSGHFIYMSPSYYKETFSKDIAYNVELLDFDYEEKDKDDILQSLLKCKKVINLTLTSDLKDSAFDSSKNMNLVMVVIIVSAGALAFIVLYNLNNINVSERIRELSTIKVLGFYDNEVTMYIVRENIILTLMGVVVGSVLGRFMYLYILNTAELDSMMMVPEVHLQSYLFASALTILFSIIVMIMMHKKLKKVNMIDALKSVE